MKQNLIRKTVKLDDNNILIRKFIKGIEGGRALDVTNWADSTIPAGQVIVRKEADGVITYFPLNWVETPAVLYTYEEYKALDGNSSVTEEEFNALPDAQKTKTAATAAYDSLGTGETYAGLLMDSLLKEFASAAIMTWGIVNPTQLPHPVPDAFKTALPHIDYQADEEA